MATDARPPFTIVVGGSEGLEQLMFVRKFYRREGERKGSKLLLVRLYARKVVRDRLFYTLNVSGMAELERFKLTRAKDPTVVKSVLPTEYKELF